MEKKFYEVEFSSTTYRTYEVEAESKEEAEEIASDDMYNDCEVGESWKEGADVTEIKELD